MKTEVKTLKILALLAIASLGLWVARAGLVDNHIEPFDLVVDVDCDGDGAPEDTIELSGGLHVLLTETTDKAGAVHSTIHYQPVNVSGVGLISGDTYRAVGITRESVSFDGNVDTFVNNFYMIGQNSGIKYLVHQTFHVTIVDGVTIVTVDHAEIRCL